MKTKSKGLLASVFVAIFMLCAVAFGITLVPTQTAQAASPQIVSVELGLDDKVPTVGEKIFYPEVISVNGDESLKGLVEIRPSTGTWQKQTSTFFDDITDDNYTFEEGIKYGYKVEIEKNPSGALDKEVVVTFAGKQSEPKTTSSFAFFFEFGYLGPEYAINVGEGVIARKNNGEIITKAHKNESVYFDVEAPAGKGLRSVSITPQNENFVCNDGAFRLTQMPAQAITVSAEYGEPIDEIRLTSQNFELGADAEDFSVTTKQNAKFSVEKTILIDYAKEDIASGDLHSGIYMLSVLIKVDEGYGFNIPLYVNDETGYHYTKAISLDGWCCSGFATMDESSKSMFDLEETKGYFGVHFYLSLSDNISCPLDGDIKMKGYEFGKTVEDVTFTGVIAGGERIDITSSVIYGFANEISNYANGFSKYHEFVLGDSYVVEIAILNSQFNISNCASDYFTINGIKPACAFKVTDSVNGHILLLYELPAVEYPKFDVIFNANGGSGTMEDAKALGGYELPACTFTAPEGKQFKGWALAPNGEVITTLVFNVVEDVEFYAIWEDVPEANYLIRFNANGASGNMSNVQASGEYTLPACTFTAPEGKQFKGWALTPDGEVITTLVYNVVEDIEFYAIWEDVPATNYLIRFNANGGSGTMEDAKALGEYALPDCTFTAPIGKKFKGWALTSNGEVITTLVYNVVEDIEFYAIWEDVPATNYLIRFNANGASGNMPNVQANGEYALPDCTFTAPIGKKFKGWALTSNGEVIEGTTINITGDTTLHAIWEDVATTQTENKPEGLSGGAIAGIVVGSVAVAGLGGFAIFWFVVKKKSFADLIAIFKK